MIARTRLVDIPSGTYDATLSDDIILVRHVGATATVRLYGSQLRTVPDGTKVTIKDYTGNAATFNITILAVSAGIQRVFENGTNTLLITTDYGFVTLVFNAFGQIWVAV